MTSFGTFSALPQADGIRFLTWALVMGLAGSWFATWCWVAASRRIPPALSAQLIVAETVFGLVYGFMFEARWPTEAEWIGSILQLAGVGAAITVFSKSGFSKSGRKPKATARH